MRKAELWLVENTISKVLLWDLIIGVPRGDGGSFLSKEVKFKGLWAKIVDVKGN